MRAPISLALIVFLPVFAFAQAAAPAAVPDGLWGMLQPVIMPAIGIVITGLATSAITILNSFLKKYRIQVNKERATTALVNAASGLIQQHGPAIAMKLEAANPAAAAAAEEAIVRPGQVFDALRMDPASIAQLIVEKIPQVLPVEVPAPVIVAPIDPATLQTASADTGTKRDGLDRQRRFQPGFERSRSRLRF